MTSLPAPEALEQKIDAALAHKLPPFMTTFKLPPAKEQPSTVAVGRGLFAARAHQPGAAVLSVPQPVYATLSFDRLDSHCSGCFRARDESEFCFVRIEPKAPASFSRCGGCLTTSYCDKECQTAHWKRGHSGVCPFFKKTPRNMLQHMNLLTRTALELLLFKDPAIPDAVLALASNMADFEADRAAAPVLKQLATAGVVIAHLAGKSHRRHDAITLLFALACNAHELVTPTYDSVGLLVDAHLGALNHSCRPNAFVELSPSVIGPQATLRPMRALRAGEELFISYIDPTDPLPQRRQKLWSRYRFDCSCPKCADDEAAAVAANAPLPPRPHRAIASATVAAAGVASPAVPPSDPLGSDPLVTPRANPLTHPALLARDPLAPPRLAPDGRRLKPADPRRRWGPAAPPTQRRHNLFCAALDRALPDRALVQALALDRAYQAAFFEPAPAGPEADCHPLVTVNLYALTRLSCMLAGGPPGPAAAGTAAGASTVWPDQSWKDEPGRPASDLLGLPLEPADLELLALGALPRLLEHAALTHSPWSLLTRSLLLHALFYLYVLLGSGGVDEPCPYFSTLVPAQQVAYLHEIAARVDAVAAATEVVVAAGRRSGVADMACHPAIVQMAYYGYKRGYPDERARVDANERAQAGYVRVLAGAAEFCTMLAKRALSEAQALRQSQILDAAAAYATANLF